MITAAPASPGTEPPVYQPAVMPWSAGGTSTVPSALRPSSIRELEIPIEGMVTLVGSAGGWVAGAPGEGVPGVPAVTGSAGATTPGGVVGAAWSGAAEQPASTVRTAGTTRARTGLASERRTGWWCAGDTTGSIAGRGDCVVAPHAGGRRHHCWAGRRAVSGVPAVRGAAPHDDGAGAREQQRAGRRTEQNGAAVAAAVLVGRLLTRGDA